MGHGQAGERGAALIIALLVITIMAFLGGVLLLMSQGGTRISSNMRQATIAFSAADAGLETILNQLPQTTAVDIKTCPTIDPRDCMTFYSGAGKTKGDTAGRPIAPLGPQAAGSGYNLENTQWNGYLVYSTGLSTTFLLFVNQMVELETQAVVGQICRGTDYTCS